MTNIMYKIQSLSDMVSEVSSTHNKNRPVLDCVLKVLSQRFENINQISLPRTEKRLVAQFEMLDGRFSKPNLLHIGQETPDAL